MHNLDLIWKRDLSPFRKLALGTWNAPGDPSVYGTIELRMDNAMRYLEAFRKATGKKLTVTHMVAKAMAEVLRQTPDANAILRLKRIYLRKGVSIFFQVAMTDGAPDKVDLSGVTMHGIDTKSLAEICDELSARATKVRQHDDPALEQSRQLFKRMPNAMVGPLLRAMSFACYTMNLDPRWFGVPQDAFGGVMITNVGSLGLDVAYAPLVPYSRVPILLAVGAVHPEPVVEDGRVVVGQVMKINATFDHRFIDGVHAACMARVMREWMEHPFEHFDAIPSADGAAQAAA